MQLLIWAMEYLFTDIQPTCGMIITQKLLNSTNNTVNKKYVSNKFKNCKVIISPLDIKEAVKDLKKGKSPGLMSTINILVITCMYFFHLFLTISLLMGIFLLNSWTL